MTHCRAHVFDKTTGDVPGYKQQSVICDKLDTRNNVCQTRWSITSCSWPVAGLPSKASPACDAGTLWFLSKHKGLPGEVLNFSGHQALGDSKVILWIDKNFKVWHISAWQKREARLSGRLFSTNMDPHQFVQMIQAMLVKTQGSFIHKLLFPV